MEKLCALLALAALAGGADIGMEQASELYHKTQYDAALRILDQVHQKDSSVLALRGKILYGKGDYKESIEALEQAVASEPHNSQYWDWLGKAYGRRAETSNFLSAPKYASQCRKSFEKSVELDPKNIDALTDVFLYYLDAPGFLGGGVEKAAAISERVRDIDAARYQNTQAQLAKKQRDFRAAEHHLRKAVELAPGKVDPVLDLALFLGERGRYEESDKLFDEAYRMAPHDPAVIFARASSFVQGKRKPEEARRLLNQYLTSDLTPEHPPRREAENLLRQTSDGG